MFSALYSVFFCSFRRFAGRRPEGGRAEPGENVDGGAFSLLVRSGASRRRALPRRGPACESAAAAGSASYDSGVAWLPARVVVQSTFAIARATFE